MKSLVTVAILLPILIGCGVMGPPVPPESIGVNVKRRNDTVERERRKGTQTRQDREDGGPPPPGQTEQTSGTSDDLLLRGDVVQPSARPDSDFLVRPR